MQEASKRKLWSSAIGKRTHISHYEEERFMQTWEICLTTGMVKSTRGSLVGVDIEGCSMTTSKMDISINRVATVDKVSPMFTPVKSQEATTTMTK